MINQSIEDAIRSVRFASGLSDGDLAKLVGISEWIDIPARTHLFTEGDPADYLFLIVRGRVELSMNIPGKGLLPLATLENGDLLGGSAALRRDTMTLTAVAILNTEAIRIHAVKLRELCDEDHDIGYEIMRRVAMALMNRLIATRLQVLDVHRDALIPRSQSHLDQAR